MEIANYLAQYQTQATEIANIHNQVETRVNSIEVRLAVIDKIYADHDTFVEKIRKLKEIFTSGDDYGSKLATLYHSMLTRKKDMDTLYYDIVGYVDTDKSSGEEVKVIFPWPDIIALREINIRPLVTMEFDAAKVVDKQKARLILNLLLVDEPSIEKILSCQF